MKVNLGKTVLVSVAALQKIACQKVKLTYVGSAA